MAKTVFWSWQSDQDERVTRHLIREALVAALERLTGTSSIEERLEIDHDTRGLPGSPDIVTSILAKIDAAAVFVGDVTPIAISPRGKHVANPNVLIELGYAKRALGTERVITVWNTAFTGSRFEDLPFDLRGRRGPITYTLAAGATREEMAIIRGILTEAFAERIGASLSVAAPAKVDAPRWDIGDDDDPSLWLAGGTDIRVNEPYGSGIRRIIPGGRWYVRVVPTSFDPAAVDAAAHGPFIGGYGGFSAGRVTGGLMTYSGSVRSNVSPDIPGATMWFRDTGEIWATETGISADWKGRKTFHGDHIPEQWASLMASSIGHLERAGAKGPFHVKVGVTGLDGLYWPLDNWLGGQPPQALEPETEKSFTVASSNPADWKDDFVAAWAGLRRVFAMPPPDEDLVQKTIGKSAA